MLIYNEKEWRLPQNYLERRWLCLHEGGCYLRPIIVNDKGDARCAVHADAEDFAIASVVQGKLD